MKGVSTCRKEQQNLIKSMVFKMVYLMMMQILIKHLMKVLFANLSIH